MADLTFLETMNALVAACQSQAIPGGSLDTVAVADGPVTERGAQQRRLFIGTSGDGVSAEGDNSESPIPGVIDNDTFAIYCVAEAYGDNIPNLRASAFALRAIVRALVRPDPSGRTLGVSSLASARLGAWTLEESQTQKGAFVGITFRIECASKPSTS